METIFRWSASRPLTALVLMGVLCAGLGLGIGRLEIDASFERLLSENDPRSIENRDLRENFGFRPVVSVVAQSPALFEASTLRALSRLAGELSKVPGIVEVSNLFSTPVPASARGEILPIPLLAEIPDDPSRLGELRDEVLSNDLARGQLVNGRGDAIQLVFFLENERRGDDLHSRILGEFHEILDRDPARAIPGLDLTVFGLPEIKRVLQAHLLWDMTRLAPVALLVVGAVIFLFFRSPAAVFLPLVTGVLSSVATLGFMGFAGFPINLFLSTIVILILVLGCTEDLHILSEYLDNLEAGMNRMEAICQTGATTGRALFLTSSTTVFSFLSIAFTDFVGLRHFAVACALGMAINFLVTIVTIPAVLVLFPRLRFPGSHRPLVLGRLGHSLENLLLSGRHAPVYLCGAIFVVSVLGCGALVRETNFLRFFWPGSETARGIDRYTEAFGGTAAVVVTMETNQRNAFRNPERFADLLRLHEFLTAEYGHPLGLANLFSEFRKAEGTSPPDSDSPPSSEELERFLKLLPREVVKPFLDYDGSRAAIRLLARGESSSSRSVLAIERRIDDFAAKTFGPEVRVRVGGEQVVSAHLCDSVIDNLLRNLLILALVTALAISIVVRSAKLGFLALIPNLFPIATTFGAMGWLGIPLGVATFPVAIVAFGIAVDDTIHFLVRFKTESSRGLTRDDAVASSLHHELRPVVATTVTVACGYLIMALSPLRSNAEVGLLFALASFSALFADLVVTPILLRRFGRSTPVAEIA